MSLSEWLDGIGLSRILESLEMFQINSTKDVAILHESDIDDIVSTLQLKPHERILFKVAVRKLQHDEPDSPKIQLDLDGQKSMKNLIDRLIEAKTSLSTVEKIIEELLTNSKLAKKSVSIQFTELRKTLEARENELISEIDVETHKKITKLQNQCDVLKKVIEDLTQVKRKSEKLMNIKNVEDTENRQTAIKTELTKVRGVDFPRDPVTNSDLRFQHEENTNDKLKTHGEVVSYGPILPPTISKLESTCNSVEVSWEPQNIQGAPADANPTNFGIKISELGDGEMKEGANPGGVQNDDLVTEFEMDAKQSSYEIKDLKRNSNYHVAMKTKNKNGWSHYGKSSHIKTKNTMKFVGTTLLDSSSKNKLIEFLGGNVREVDLLYKASVHGFKGSDFHQRCDNKGSTVTVIKRNGSPIIFGGYTTVPWESPGIGKYKGDGSYNSFVFTMDDGNGQAKKFQHKNNPQHAICCNKNYGPYFGNEGAIGIVNNSNTKTGSCTNGSVANSYCVPTNETLCGQYDGYTIDEIEVFSVKL